MEREEELYRRYFKLLAQETDPYIRDYAGTAFRGEPNPHAASLQAISAFLKESPGGTIIDAGAGATTFVMRGMGRKVITVDPDLTYSQAVRRMCEREGMDTSGFMRSVLAVPMADYLFHDYGTRERAPAMRLLLQVVRKHAYIDDTDLRECCKPLREYTKTLIDEREWEWRDRPDLEDGFGRWGVTLTRRNKSV